MAKTGFKMRYIDDDLSGKTILITGGAGFIGSNLAFYFQTHHPKAEVVIFDSFRTGEVFSNGNVTKSDTAIVKGINHFHMFNGSIVPIAIQLL